MNEEILEITKKFHDTYEKLSKEYNYETRKETRVFDINSSNGKLMYATVNEIMSPVLEENQNLKKQLENKYEKVGTLTGELLYEENTKLINQQKEVKEVIDRILNETKETRNILNNNRNNNMLSKSCLLSYLEIVEDLLKEVSE